MTPNASARRFQIKAIVDDVSSCECCGKTGLQRTVAIEDCETGEIRYFGTSCAMQPAKGFGIEKAEMNRGLNRYKEAQGRLWDAARATYRQRGGGFVNVMIFDKKFGQEFPEKRLADQPLFDSICKDLGGVKAFLR